MAAEASIVIPTVGRAALLAGVLRALEQQAGTCGVEVEVIVVCDGEDAATRTLSSELHPSFPLEWIFLPENRGHAAARNAGVARARGAVIIFLDDDTMPADGWLQAHVKHHADRRADRVVLGPLRHVYAGAPRTSLELFLRDAADNLQTRLEISLGRPDAERGRNLWVGLNSSLSKELITAGGGYDESLRHVEEDAEFAVRISRLGATFEFEAGALLYHRSTKDLVRVHEERAEQFARADIYRVRDKHQQAAQWPVLAALFDSGGAQKAKHRLAWYAPWAALVIGGACRVIGEALGVRLLLSQWADLAFKARYWGRIKDEGLSLSDLRNLVE